MIRRTACGSTTKRSDCIRRGPGSGGRDLAGMHRLIPARYTSDVRRVGEDQCRGRVHDLRLGRQTPMPSAAGRTRTGRSRGAACPGTGPCRRSRRGGTGRTPVPGGSGSRRSRGRGSGSGPRRSEDPDVEQERLSDPGRPSSGTPKNDSFIASRLKKLSRTESNRVPQRGSPSLPRRTRSCWLWRSGSPGSRAGGPPVVPGRLPVTVSPGCRLLDCGQAAVGQPLALEVLQGAVGRHLGERQVHALHRDCPPRRGSRGTRAHSGTPTRAPFGADRRLEVRGGQIQDEPSTTRSGARPSRARGVEHLDLPWADHVLMNERLVVPIWAPKTES